MFIISEGERIFKTGNIKSLRILLKNVIMTKLKMSVYSKQSQNTSHKFGEDNYRKILYTLDIKKLNVKNQ